MVSSLDAASSPVAFLLAVAFQEDILEASSPVAFQEDILEASSDHGLLQA
jgi:hypothetical protein